MTTLEKLMARATPDKEAIRAQIATWPEKFRAIAESLLEGQTQQATAMKCGCLALLVRGVGEEIGWNPRWRLFGHNSKKVFGSNNLPWTFAHEQYLKGATLEEIGNAAGCTLERVRQILRYLELVPRRDTMPPLRAAKQLAKATEIIERAKRLKEFRAQAHDAHYESWRAMWADGLKLRDMAEKLGAKPNAVGCTISTLRRRHTDWFPYRQRKIVDE